MRFKGGLLTADVTVVVGDRRPPPVRPLLSGFRGDAVNFRTANNARVELALQHEQVVLPLSSFAWETVVLDDGSCP